MLGAPWVLSVPKHIRPCPHHNPTIAGAVLHIFLPRRIFPKLSAEFGRAAPSGLSVS